MDTTTIGKDIIDSVLAYRKIIVDSGISVDKIILFGSYAKGNARAESDIDIAVISPQFGVDEMDERQALSKKRRFVDLRIEAYPLSPDEYEHGFSHIVSEIRKYGIQVA